MRRPQPKADQRRAARAAKERGKRSVGNSLKPKRRTAQPEMKKAAFVVLGMHRSGTSALTRVLNLLGCGLPKTLMAASHGNEQGHWESKAIYQLNDRILSSAGSDWRDWTPFNPGWYNSPLVSQFRDEALATLKGEFGTSPLFVLKDPRICRLSKFWFDTLEDFGATPFIVLPLRNPLEVAASLNARNGIDVALGSLQWLRHVLDAEYVTRGQRRHFVSYDLLLGNWRQTIERLQKTFNVSLPSMSAATGMQIDTFLSDRHRNQRVASASLTENPEISEWIRQSYQILDRWAKDGENATDFVALDAIRNAFDAATPAFARLIVKSIDNEKRLVETSAKLEESEDASAKILADVRAKLSHSESALIQRRHEADQLAAELAAVRKDTAAELATVRKDKAEELAAVRRDTAAELAALRSERAAELSKYREDLAKVNSEKQEVEKRLSERFDEIAGLTEMLQSGRKERAAELSKYREDLAKANSDKQATEKRLGERFDEIAALTKMLQSGEAAIDQFRRKMVTLVEINGSRFPLPDWIFRKARLYRKIGLLKRTGLFDAEWYLKANADVRKAGIDPHRHFVEHGAQEGRLPNALFQQGKKRARS